MEFGIHTLIMNLSAFLAIVIVLSGCVGGRSELVTPRDKLRAASTALLIRCRGDLSDEQIRALWAREFPGQEVYPFLSSAQGQEVMRIMKQYEDKTCNFKGSPAGEDKQRMQELLSQ